MTHTSGSYAHLEVVDGDWAKHRFPDDPEGNVYKCMGNVQRADLRYLGADPDSYRVSYSKETHAARDDWSDLIELTGVMSADTSDDAYAEQVKRVVNVEQWLRFLAVNTLADNRESSIGNGVGDEYFLYCGVNDARFVLIQWDLEHMFGVGDESATSVLTAGIFRGENCGTGPVPEASAVRRVITGI